MRRNLKFFALIPLGLWLFLPELARARRLTDQMTIEQINKLVTNLKGQFPALSFIPNSVVLSIVELESNFNPSAVGKAKEYGLMQIMPATYKEHAEALGIDGQDPFNPYYNVLVGMTHLKWIHDRMEGKTWFSIVQAYNVGLRGFREGRRNWEYVAYFLRGNIKYSFYDV